MIVKIIVWLVLAMSSSYVVRVLLMLDWNKRVYNHEPGVCLPVQGEGGHGTNKWWSVNLGNTH